GRLDFDDELLATFDYVVASVHSHFGQSQEDMTARIIRAIRNRFVTMLGHATGRLLLQRESYKVDWRRCSGRRRSAGRWSKSTPTRTGWTSTGSTANGPRRSG